MTRNLLESDKQKPRILISGETGGTGASTTSKLLAEQLQLSIISGGKYFRALANRFMHFQYQNPSMPVERQYEIFLAKYNKVFTEQGIDGVSKLMEQGIIEGANGETLAIFSAEIEKSKGRNAKIDTVWDYIVDQKTMSEALEKSGFIWESKLAVLSLKLDQLQPIVSRHTALTLPYLNVLLSLNPKVAAKRVSERENRKVGEDEILVRKKRDFVRYGDMYQINGQRVQHQDLFTFADIVINTESSQPEEVATIVLNAYLQKITLLGLLEKPFALLAIEEVNQAIKKLQS